MRVRDSFVKRVEASFVCSVRSVAHVPPRGVCLDERHVSLQCCRVLQCVTMCCNAMQCDTVLQGVAGGFSVLSVLKCAEM